MTGLLYSIYDPLDPKMVELGKKYLASMGYDSDDQHTRSTAHRLTHYLNFWQRPQVDTAHLTMFENCNPTVKGMIVVAPIPFWSCCSHHLLPFFGSVYFGYIPGDRIIGLSKIALFVQDLCARPWVQETMTFTLANFFCEQLAPRGLGIITRGMHTCQMLELGPIVPTLTVSEFRGTLRSPREPEEVIARQELLSLAGVTGVT